MPSGSKAREWFELGATALASELPGRFDRPTYLCPICLVAFTAEALDDGSLSVEHVPPRSVGGQELLLTCRRCNNSSGTKLDAHAKTKEEVRAAMAGMSNRPHKIRVTIGADRLNGTLLAAGGNYSLQIPAKLNKPGTAEALKNVAKAGTPLGVQYQPYADLGVKISWLRSGYLALFAWAGYKVALDPAMRIVREQILECDERKMITFTQKLPDEIPFTERRILQAIEPSWHRGWAVQFGRYVVQFPSPGDVDFYERLAAHALEPLVQYTTYQNKGWPTSPTFGLPAR